MCATECDQTNWYYQWGVDHLPCSPAFCGRVGVGLLVPRGSCGSQRLGQGGGPCSGSSLGRGEGGPSPLPRGGGGRRPRGLRAGGVVGGAGSRRGLPAPPLGGAPRFLTLAPLLSSAHSPQACAFGRGRGAAPGGGGGGIPPASGRWGPAPQRLAGRCGGWAGGVPPRPPCSPSRGRPAVPYPGPSLVVGALPPGVRVRSGSRGRAGGGGG